MVKFAPRALLAASVIAAAAPALAQGKRPGSAQADMSPALRSAVHNVAGYAGEVAKFLSRLGAPNDLNHPDLTKREDVQRWHKVAGFCMEAIAKAYAAGAIAEQEIPFDTRGLSRDGKPMASPQSLAETEQFCGAARLAADAHQKDIAWLRKEEDDPAKDDAAGPLSTAARLDQIGRHASVTAQGLSRLKVNDGDRPNLTILADYEHWRTNIGLCILNAERAERAGVGPDQQVKFKTWGARLKDNPVAGSQSFGEVKDFCQAARQAAEDYLLYSGLASSSRLR